MIVAAAADVAVLDGRRVGHGLGAIGAIEVVAQDRDDGAIGARADVDAALAGRFDPFGAIAAHQAQDAEARPEALFGMRLGVEDQLDQSGGGWTNPGRLAPQPGRRPIGITPVCARHVIGDGRVPMRLWAAHVRGDADAVMEYLNRAIGDACLDHLADQAMRHRVPVAVDLDVVVEA
jgi:hypothetical protein